MRNPTELKNCIDHVIGISPCQEYHASTPWYTCKSGEKIRNKITIRRQIDNIRPMYSVNICTICTISIPRYASEKTLHICPHDASVTVNHINSDGHRYGWVWHFHAETDDSLLYGFHPYLHGWSPCDEHTKFLNEIINALING